MKQYLFLFYFCFILLVFYGRSEYDVIFDKGEIKTKVDIVFQYSSAASKSDGNALAYYIDSIVSGKDGSKQKNIALQAYIDLLTIQEDIYNNYLTSMDKEHFYFYPVKKYDSINLSEEQKKKRRLIKDLSVKEIAQEKAVYGKFLGTLFSGQDVKCVKEKALIAYEKMLDKLKKEVDMLNSK